MFPSKAERRRRGTIDSAYTRARSRQPPPRLLVVHGMNALMSEVGHVLRDDAIDVGGLEVALDGGLCGADFSAQITAPLGRFATKDEWMGCDAAYTAPGSVVCQRQSRLRSVSRFRGKARRESAGAFEMRTEHRMVSLRQHPYSSRSPERHNHLRERNGGIQFALR